MINRSYLPYKSAREYLDRGMAKWMGFLISEHSSALSKEQIPLTLNEIPSHPAIRLENTMNPLEKNNIQFDYFSKNYSKFEEDFYAVSKLNIPLTFLADDILKLMVSSEKSFFRLNSLNAKDDRNHYFLFKEISVTENTAVKKYEYIGHKAE